MTTRTRWCWCARPTEHSVAALAPWTTHYWTESWTGCVSEWTNGVLVACLLMRWGFAIEGREYEDRCCILNKVLRIRNNKGTRGSGFGWWALWAFETFRDSEIRRESFVDFFIGLLLADNRTRRTQTHWTTEWQREPAQEHQHILPGAAPCVHTSFFFPPDSNTCNQHWCVAGTFAQLLSRSGYCACCMPPGCGLV